MFNVLKQKRIIQPSEDFLQLAGLYSNKVFVKDIVTRKVPELKVAKLIRTYDSFDSINLNELPEQFVIKTSHWCGDVRVIQSKDVFLDNYKKLSSHFNSLLSKVYNPLQEPHYKYIKPILFIEEYLGEEKLDVKIHCIHGRPVLFNLMEDGTSSGLYRDDHPTFAMHDINWNPLNFIIIGKDIGRISYPKPSNLNEIISIASRLSENIDYVRIDLYLDGNNNLTFGEYTFTPRGCMAPHFTNSSIDNLLHDIYMGENNNLNVFDKFKR